MVASEFLAYITGFNVVQHVGLEDLADRLNIQWNVIVLFICMLLVTVKTYFRSSIVCYFPTSVGGTNAETYVTDLCWVEGLIPFNISDPVIPQSDAHWRELEKGPMSKLT